MDLFLQSVRKFGASVSKSIGIMVRQPSRIVAAILHRDWEAAGQYFRMLSLSIHEDLLAVLVGMQRRLPFWSLSRRKIDRILIVKLDRIGDMVTTTPAIDALRALYPTAQLDIVGHPTPLSMLDGDERISQRMHYRSWLYHPLPMLPPGPKSLLLILKLLWRRYPLVVYLRGSAPFLLLGMTSRFAASKYVWAEPVIDRYLNAIRGACGPVDDFSPSLRIADEDADFARRLLNSDSDTTGPAIVIHAAASSAAKMWPAERFASLADELHRRHRARVHFLGSPADRSILDTIRDLSKCSHAYHWSLRLPESIAVIAAADLFIGNDSGLAHAAAAVGTATVVLWGPANLSMAQPKADPERCVILYHEFSCRNSCLEFRCHNANAYECLTRITTADVLAAVDRLLLRKVEAQNLALAPAGESSHAGLPRRALCPTGTDCR